VECFLPNRLCHNLGLRPLVSKQYDPRVMVLHRQAPIVLGRFHFADIFAGLQTTARQIAGSGEGLCRELLRVAGVDEHGRAVTFQDVTQALQLDLGEAA
jgi:hypothetical protein